MSIIKVQKFMEGEIRIVISKKSVPGYKKNQTDLYPELVCFVRGNTRYCFDSDFYCFFKTKVDSPCKYLPVTFDDFHKFFEIQTINAF